MYQYDHECKGDLCPVHKLDNTMMRRVYSKIITEHMTTPEIKILDQIVSEFMLPDDGHRVLDEESLPVLDKVAKVAKYYAEDAARFVAGMSE